MAWNNDFWKEVLEAYEAQSFEDNDGDISLTKNKREIAGELIGELIASTGAAPDMYSIYSEKITSLDTESIIDGYYVDYRDNGDCVLHLLSILDYVEAEPQEENPLKDLEKLESFRDGIVETITNVLDNNLLASDGHEEEEEMYSQIKDYQQDISQVSIHVFYWGNVGKMRELSHDISSDNNLTFRVNLWDALRADLVHKNEDTYESLDIEIADYSEQASISAIKVHEESDNYDAYLATLPADFLADVYEEFGAQLMETNVRAFLGKNRKINKGIRKTIHDNPEKFFIFNNGLCVTAEKVHYANQKNSDIVKIAGLKGMQIVNGGQTVASLHTAKYKEQGDLSSIRVQVKLTEIFGENHSELVHEISRYSNSQNAVIEADFASSAKIHMEMEELSKSTMAPTNTQWFYERSRGQYDVAVNNYKNGTAKDKVVFQALFPKKQKMEKLLIARWHYSYESKPYIIGEGRQYAFLKFMEDWTKAGEYSIDAKYFKDLVAKGIVYEEAGQLCKDLKIASCKSNIADLATSILWKDYGEVIDLNVIWENQGCGEAIRATLKDWIPRIYKEFEESARTSPEVYGTNTNNPREWAKKEKCWTHIYEWSQRVDLQADSSMENSRIESIVPGGAENVVDREHFLKLERIRAKCEDANAFRLMIECGHSNAGEFGLMEKNGQCFQSMIAGTVMGNIASSKKVSEKQANRVIQLIDAYDSKR